MSRAASLPGAELFLKSRTFLNKPLVPGSFTPWSGTFSQKSDLQEFWDSFAQNKTSEISTFGLSGIFATSVRRTRRRKSQQHALSGILGLLGAEQDVGNLKNALSGILDSRKQNKTSEISKNTCSGTLGLLGTEQDVGNLKTCTFRNSGTPSCAQNKTSEI